MARHKCMWCCRFSYFRFHHHLHRRHLKQSDPLVWSQEAFWDGAHIDKDYNNYIYMYIIKYTILINCWGINVMKWADTGIKKTPQNLLEAFEVPEGTLMKSSPNTCQPRKHTRHLHLHRKGVGPWCHCLASAQEWFNDSNQYQPWFEGRKNPKRQNMVQYGKMW